jgi:DNA (cytosine-5)-methyltransferase 1
MLSTRRPILASVNAVIDTQEGEALRVAGLFAGIGGIELGLHAAAHRTALLCEKDQAAARVLRARFPGIELHDDVTTLDALPDVDLVAAGFPCQDLSQAGRTAGIRGGQSSLVDHVFRLLDRASSEPRWLLLENVPFMLQLDRGRAMTHLTDMLSSRGYTWAYRVVDTRAFGLPQRRQRVLLLASRTHDPRPVLYAEQAEPAEPPVLPDSVYGFYWTEGLRGLGLAVDAVPTLKGGSTIGIPSPPAVWMRGHADEPLVTPDLRDAERLQGFDADWTAPAVDEPRRRNGPRWKLVGNAVSVPVASWLGRQLVLPPRLWAADETERDPSRPWPNAAWGSADATCAVDIGMWPVVQRFRRLVDFLEYEPRLLSQRAAAGFLERAQRSSLRFPRGFKEAVAEHCDRVAHLVRAA